tara:strand:- start:43 stop:249 length:207 start_codon:yes stop_codon:yes gene_type:complete
MGKVKSYMMDIEEKVFDIEGLEEKIGECEHMAEMKAWVVEKLGLTTHFDIGIAEDVVEECWVDFWAYY